MDEFSFEFPRYGFLLFLVPCVALLYVYRLRRRKKYLDRVFGTRELQNALTNFNVTGYLLKGGLMCAGVTALILALMGPQGNPDVRKVEKSGRDLFFVLDVSKSMLADDLKPNRLEKAKEYILSVLDVLEGDRVGLIVFAGSNAIKSPLTNDYSFFRKVLNDVDTNSLTYGGTRIGDAIRAVTGSLARAKKSRKDIILITDGEDHESEPLKAAQSAAENGIVINTVGIGAPDGTTIAIAQGGGRSTQTERVILSKLDEVTLRQIAQITSGIYIPAQTKRLNLGKIYRNHIANKQERNEEQTTVKTWQKYYQYSALLGLALLLASWYVPERHSGIGKAKISKI